MMTVTFKLHQRWINHIRVDFPQDPESIATWLLGPTATHPSFVPCDHLTQQMDYRYRILQKRYLQSSSSEGYQRLIRRLSVIIVTYPPIARKLAQIPHYHASILLLTQNLLNEIIHYDLEVQRMIKWIGQITPDQALQEKLLLASLEEHCSQLIHNQPMILHRLRQFLRQEQVILSA